jgi:hypothetical protein
MLLKKSIVDEKLPSGAKARTLFQRLSGTSELVPFPAFASSVLFSATCKAAPFQISMHSQAETYFVLVGVIS